MRRLEKRTNARWICKPRLRGGQGFGDCCIMKILMELLWTSLITGQICVEFYKSKEIENLEEYGLSETHFAPLSICLLTTD